jgi:hypothetical protein
MLRGQSPHQPHRDHFYQRAALGAGNHRPVVLWAIAVNMLLLALALLSTFVDWIASAAALGVTCLALLQLRRMANSKPTIEAGHRASAPTGGVG